MNITDIVLEYLDQHGYDGLCNDDLECCCHKRTGCSEYQCIPECSPAYMIDMTLCEELECPNIGECNYQYMNVDEYYICVIDEYETCPQLLAKEKAKCICQINESVDLTNGVVLNFKKPSFQQDLYFSPEYDVTEISDIVIIPPVKYCPFCGRELKSEET